MQTLNVVGDAPFNRTTHISSLRRQITHLICRAWMTIAAISNDILSTINRISESVEDLFSSALSTPTSSSPIGGIINVGNSCYISLVLQQFAAEPRFFTLQFADQANPLTQKMKTCIEAIQEGRQVSKKEIQELIQALIDNGWTEKAGDPGDPLKLLTFIATIFKVNQLTYDQWMEESTLYPEPVVYLTDKKSFAIESLACTEHSNVLWVINHPHPTKIPQETIFTKTHRFELRAVHMKQTYFWGSKHMYCLRKEKGTWYKCNDAKISAVALNKVPTSQMCRLVYVATLL